ncbi:hypothetical protein R1sor_025138 [Riccia sorocarpa]|uniref:Uncharacterized protein n=1 Tax=Riccia sorocarpa TaxID=122646 RepID=A0ABD3GB06_9MARC
MDPPGFVTVWCNRSRKPLVLFYDDNEVFAVADEPILAWMFKLEGGTGSIYIVVEEHSGDDSDGDAFFVGRPVQKPFVQGEITSGDAPVVCKLCSSLVLCDSICGAEMFYITFTVEDSSSSSHSGKTRAYMHVGNHNHIITPVISQEVRVVAEETIREILHASPTAKSGVVAGCSAGGKRKFSDGSCLASAIPVASDSETSDDVVEAKMARSDPLETEGVTAVAGHQVDENAEEIVFFHSAVRQFGFEISDTEVDEGAWHIARISGKSPVCRAKTRGTARNSRPQCGAYVARQPYAKFPAPTFRQPQERYRETRFSSDRFWCCLNDVCSFGKLADFLERRKPKVPSVWPVVGGTHLTQIEVDELTKYGFRLIPFIAPVHVLEPSINDIRSVVNVECFPEDLSSLSPSFAAKSRAGRPVNRRHAVSRWRKTGR